MGNEEQVQNENVEMTRDGGKRVDCKKLEMEVPQDFMLLLVSGRVPLAGFRPDHPPFVPQSRLACAGAEALTLTCNVNVRIRASRRTDSKFPPEHFQCQGQDQSQQHTNVLIPAHPVLMSMSELQL